MQAYGVVVGGGVFVNVLLDSEADAFMVAIALVVGARNVIIHHLDRFEMLSRVKRRCKRSECCVLCFSDSEHIIAD